MTLENVKSFVGSQEFRFGPRLNFIVGNNNTGKSSVLEALQFLFEGPTAYRFQPDDFYSVNAAGPTRVTVELAGDVEALVARDEFAVLAPYVFDKDDLKILRLQRSSEKGEVLQGKKSVARDVKKIFVWNPESSQYENPTGIDARIKGIVDLVAIWADARPDDHLDFSTTKTLGRLLSAYLAPFKQTKPWLDLVAAHEAAFSTSGEQSLVNTAEQLTRDLEQVVGEQYGDAKFRLNFTLPDASAFLKEGELLVSEVGGETPIKGKGTGMQRAVALAAIQIYARTVRSTSAGDASKVYEKPMLLLVDEPETWLHPSAQIRLAQALGRVGDVEQVLVVTHSPYMFQGFVPGTHALTVVNGVGADKQVRQATELGTLHAGAPSWGEINYLAFDLVSTEFHNELYGLVQSHLESQNDAEAKEAEIDRFLVDRGLLKTKNWKRSSAKEYPVTLPQYVRNAIHHPENQLNQAITEGDLRNSIQQLLEVLRSFSTTSP